MKVFKSILLDDEQLGLEATRFFLHKVPFIQVVAETSTLDEAEREILFHKPDILFLDIKIYDTPVFELLDRLENRNLHFGIVFITAYENDYLADAMKACEMKYKWTYFHKPINTNAMLDALNKFRREISGEKDDRYIFHQQGKVLQLFYEDILYCETAGNNSTIHTLDGNKEVVTENLTTLENKLPRHLFYRMSGQYIINRNHLRGAYKSNNRYIALIRGNGEDIKLTLPRDRWTALRQEFPASES